ncbi:SPASM domain-containing protein [Pseudovibrio ascidiaceicola]|uniref:SPASM domain-containing protein n=1 Tax=Pseudovibrio ascidiaceicola TaxID=285279 RepID=UPI003D35B841
MERTFLYHINLTRECNLRCSHCYIHTEVKKRTTRLSGADLEKMAHGIVQHMENTSYTVADIFILGGEPSIMGLEYFETHIPKFREILSKGKFKTKLNIVSNLLHDDIVPMCRLFDNVNTSWEPVSRFKPKIEARWRDKVQELREDGHIVYLTSAITKPLVQMGGAQAANYLYEELGFKKIHFGFFIPSGDGLTYADAMLPAFNKTSQFLIELCDWYVERREIDSELCINPVESMIASLAAGQPLDDIVCPMTSGSMDIDYDGNAMACIEGGGRVAPDWSGNVLKTSVLDVTKSKHYRESCNKVKRINPKCMGCEYFQVCRSGCSVVSAHSDLQQSDECHGFKRFIQHVENLTIKGLKPKYGVSD